MTVITGWMLILFMVLVTLAVGRYGGMSWPRTRCGRCGVLVLGTVLALLLFRPDEEIEIGEDPGAYFNVALSFAQHQRLRFPDPALSEVPVNERFAFRYGHEGFMITKDASLWADDQSMNSVGPHFLPAYSLLLGVPAFFGLPYLGFFISPILALLIGWMLSVLARWLTGVNAAGWIAFLLYILNPVIVWNARCLRAEWPASFLAIAGMLPWMAHVILHKPVSRRMAAFAGFSLTLAAFFHITALYVLIPAGLASLWLTRRTRFWTGWWMGLVFGIILFVAQIVWISDPYGLLSTWDLPSRRRLILGAGALLIVIPVALRFLWTTLCVPGTLDRVMPFRRSRQGRILRGDLETKIVRVVGGSMGLLFLAGVSVSLFAMDSHGRIPGFPAWTAPYISLTDFQGVYRMISRYAFVLALAGLLWMPVRAGNPGRMGRWLLVWLAPSSLTIGWVFNYMFETRRMLTFLIPLLILSLTVFIVGFAGGIPNAWKRLAIGRRRPWLKPFVPDLSLQARRMGFPGTVFAGLACGLTLLILAAGLRGRIPLYTTWNNQGVYRFYRNLARDVRDAGDFLFAEYTQTAVPVERLSGLPLLPVAWGYRSEIEYRVAESVMRRLVHEHPDRKYLVMTPFSSAAVPGLYLEPLLTKTLTTHRLERARRTVPLNVVPRDLTMTVYRTLTQAPTDENPVYTRLMKGSRLGLSGGANAMGGRTLLMNGMALKAGQKCRIDLLPAAPEKAERFFFVFHADSSKNSGEIKINVRWEESARNTLPAEMQRFSPAPGWRVVQWERPGGIQAPFPVEISLSDAAFLTDILYTSGTGNAVASLQSQLELEPFSITDVDSQWLRAKSAVVLPGRSTPGWLWVLATTGHPERKDVTLSVTSPDVADPGAAATVAPEWRWTLLALPASKNGSGVFKWHDFQVDPPWDPRLSNFPDDLGIRVHAITTLPDLNRKPDNRTVKIARNEQAIQ